MSRRELLEFDYKQTLGGVTETPSSASLGSGGSSSHGSLTEQLRAQAAANEEQLKRRLKLTQAATRSVTLSY